MIIRMPNLKLTVQSNFTKPHKKHPVIPNKLTIDTQSLMLLKHAIFGVSFTGIVYLPRSIIYLHPLKATRAGNAEIGGVDASFHVSGVGVVMREKRPKPILHPNLTPALRAQSNLTSGHSQICSLYGFKEDECIGFSISKGVENSKLGVTSRTLNSEKFVVSPMPIGNGTQVQQLLMRRNLLQPRHGDGGLSKEWAYFIANTIDIHYSYGGIEAISTAPF